MKKRKLNRYKIVYRKGNIEIEASDVREHGEYITFLDQYGEDECKFYKDDILNYYKV